jgi:arylsulfatase A-like enzyme
MGKDKYDAFRFTPFASSFTFDFAKTVVENEKMGSNTEPDFLALSISSTDYTGHLFGPNSIEVEDTYLRLDRDISDFLNWLDAKVGKGNYLFFLTADHAVSHTAGFLKEHQIPAGTFSNYGLQNELNKMIKEKFGIDKLVPSVQNYQVYINKSEITKQGKNEAEIIKEIILLLEQKPFVLNVFETGKIMMESISQPQKEYMLNGYNIQRSGDIQFMLKPGYYDGPDKGTTHGSWNPYDAHIPLLFYGWSIKHGKTFREVYMTDIAPTVAALLQVQMPNGNVGNVLPEIIH